jgi:hypothetical protein
MAATASSLDNLRRVFVAGLRDIVGVRPYRSTPIRVRALRSIARCSMARRSSSDRMATADFVALRTNRGAAQAALVAFDLQFENEDWRKLALEVRRAQLGSLVSRIEGLTFSESIDVDDAMVFAHACKLGLKGSSQSVWAASTRAGRCRNWLKVKNAAF